MFIHRNPAYFLIALAALLMPGCASMSPNHYGKFHFKGTVKDADGKPVPNAWVKIKGWETLTNAQGQWQQEQVLHCGTLKEHMDSYEENDQILVMAEGFEPQEERFIVKHPGYFQSCQAEQTLAFDTVLQRQSDEIRKNKAEANKVQLPKDSPIIPLPPEKSYSKGRKGKVTL